MGVVVTVMAVSVARTESVYGRQCRVVRPWWNEYNNTHTNAPKGDILWLTSWPRFNFFPLCCYLRNINFSLPFTRLHRARPSAALLVEVLLKDISLDEIIHPSPSSLTGCYTESCVVECSERSRIVFGI